MLYFEDFHPGETRRYGVMTIEHDDMLAFSREFDPQPMHLDPSSGQAALMGGLIASGWFTAAANMRLLYDGVLHETAALGAPGITELKWLAPVRAGDRLAGTLTTRGKRASATRPERGFVEFALELVDAAGTPVFSQRNLIMIGLRVPGAGEASSGVATKPADESFSADPTADMPGYIEDIQPGAVVRFGSHRFEEAAMLRFARRFDPQPFHLSKAAGRASPFGGLAASGWYTAAAWMRQVIERWAEAERRRSLPRRGPGFGFTDLQWKKPVFAGDTLTYYARIVSARKSASRPGWGILTQRNYALNQHGEAVFAFTGAVLWEARA